MVVGRGSGRFHKGDKSSHGEFTFSEDDELWDAHLEVTRGNKTCPEDGRYIAYTVLALTNKLGTEPEALYEHSHHHELGECSSDAPDGNALVRSRLELVKYDTNCLCFVKLRIERFDRRNC